MNLKWTHITIDKRDLKESATRPVLAAVSLVGAGEQMGYLIWD